MIPTSSLFFDGLNYMSYFSRNSLRCSGVTVGDEDMLKTFFLYRKLKRLVRCKLRYCKLLSNYVPLSVAQQQHSSAQAQQNYCSTKFHRYKNANKRAGAKLRNLYMAGGGEQLFFYLWQRYLKFSRKTICKLALL